MLTEDVIEEGPEDEEEEDALSPVEAVKAPKTVASQPTKSVTKPDDRKKSVSGIQIEF